MDQGPTDTELRNIIDKLAQFVARNGPEFEQMTKNKQKDNPKFGFLFGGEYFNYYQYKVTTEQAILKQKGINPMQNADPRLNVSQQQQAASPVSQLKSVPLTPGVTAQNNGLNQVVGIGSAGAPSSVVTVPIGGPASAAPTMGPAAAIGTAALTGVTPGVNGPPGWLQNELANLQSQQSTLQEQVRQSEQNLAAQHAALMAQQQGRVEEAVKQAQETNLQNSAQSTSTDLAAFEAVLQPIIESCTKDSISAGKAWILQNSITPESNQVVADHLLKKVIQGSAFSQKLHIVYLVNDVLHHCARKKSMDLRKAMESVVVPMFCNASLAASEEQVNKLNKLLSLWESKNNYFDEGIIEKLKKPSSSWSEYQASLVSLHASSITPITTTTKQTFDNYQAQHQAFVNHALRQIQTIEQQKIAIDQQLNAPPPPPPALNPPSIAPPSLPAAAPISGDLNFTQPPPGWGAPAATDPPPFTTVPLPDFSKPPPGFGPPPLIHEPSVEDLLPSMPYFELPAGLMVPLIKLEDGEYRPLDPDAIRLPPPAPPSDRLVAAVEAFYAPPNHDSPRDSDGWEKLGLYEYFKAKNAARKRKEEDISAGVREKTRSPSPISRPRSKSPSPPKKRYRSKSRSRSRSRSKGRSRSRSPTSNHRRNNRNANHNSRSKRRRNSNKERSPERRDRQDRSPSPPSFLGSNYNKGGQESSLDESNKGHQLLKKMGWGGAGLGANEQGIEAPISGGEIRDRNDQYKGVGLNINDPYENFRKSKGQAFITRMKARAEERAEERGD
ncbi:calcium homeostasis endoplasmic reticulum protein isoform X2 [Belonocnema kinseyi]|uniref:calcium homeostasis endoplasmic reticulum protein isoform X2 n=1 Tax=Belonocnema kinseyi TaxID=2817044 RepID=UPI00143D8D92|nr:calcium homeostasis endoplasmic reticulum protein isoform X2 [Belonocnema kinseyi]